MVLLQALLLTIFRSGGRILNTTLGWATTMLFGKVASDRQRYLSIITFGCLIWFVALIGVISPSFGAWLLAFVRLPEWVDDNWIRLAMLGGVAILPVIVGFVSVLMIDPAKRPTGSARLAALLRGYPYTLGLALTLVMMGLFAPLMKFANMRRRWISRHVPVIVEPQDYAQVVNDVQTALRAGGIETVQAPTSWMLRFPTRVLEFFAGASDKYLIADQLTSLRSRTIEILLYPSDLVISGGKWEAARVQALIVKNLTYSKAYLTWTKEANQVEDRLRSIWIALRSGSPVAAAAWEDLQRIERDLATLRLPYEEWEVLFRGKLLVERAFLRGDHAKEPTVRGPGEKYIPLPATHSGPSTNLARVLALANALAVLFSTLTALVQKRYPAD